MLHEYDCVLSDEAGVVNCDWRVNFNQLEMIDVINHKLAVTVNCVL